MLVDIPSILDIHQVVNLYRLAKFEESPRKIVLIDHKRVHVKHCYKILAIELLIPMSISN